MSEGLSPKERKDFDSMMKRAASSASKRMFHPSFSFPTPDSLDAMIDALKQYGIEGVCFSACALGASKTIRFASRMGETDLKTLNLDTNAIGQSGAAAVFKKLCETKIETVSVANNNLPEKAGRAVLQGLQTSHVTSLDVTNNPLGDAFVTGLADVLKQKDMKSLTLSHIMMTEKSAETLAKAIKTGGVASLDVSRNALSTRGVHSIIKALPETPLKRLNVMTTGLNESEADFLIATLPDTRITDVAFSVSERPSDKFTEKLYAYLEHPSCRLENANISLPRQSGYETNRLHKALETMRSNARTRIFFQNLAARNANNDAPADITLQQALDTGVLKQALDNRRNAGKPLSAEECFRSVGYAQTPFLIYAAEAEMLPLLFSSGNWKDPKEMQKVWNALPEEHRWQMDGKKGRPLFQREKNEVTRRSLTAVLAVKKGKSR